jgi:hypothetical protein
MRRPEQALQIAVAAFLRHALKPPVVWTAIGHGGGGKVRGAILKAMGLRAGMPDVLIVAPGCDGYMGVLTPYVVGLELKADKGRQSDTQRTLAADWEACGAFYYIARSVDEVEGFLKGVGIPLHATTGRAA